MSHDPKGKVRHKLKDGVTGDAVFYGANKEYRVLLTRRLLSSKRAALWLGMNPSTADHSVNDPTVTRECNFSKAWGYGLYYKGNVSAYRATHPSDLTEENIYCPYNIPRLHQLVIHRRVDAVFLAHGVLPDVLHDLGERTVKIICAAAKKKNIPVYALALSKDGWPRHPLYLSKKTVPFLYSPS